LLAGLLAGFAAATREEMIVTYVAINDTNPMAIVRVAPSCGFSTRAASTSPVPRPVVYIEIKPPVWVAL
jgi:hypothetical protein